MINIDEMSDRQKSEKITQAMTGLDGNINLIYQNLYKPENMALAWRVLIYFAGLGYDDAIEMWFSSESICVRETAQRLWLDKILEIAIEAGMIK